jgi:hypothetical protein
MFPSPTSSERMKMMFGFVASAANTVMPLNTNARRESNDFMSGVFSFLAQR